MERLKLLRKNANLTMKALGRELGMAESTISLYESGKRCPDIQTLIRFADYFGVSLDYLCGRDEMPAENLSSLDKGLLDKLNELNDEGKEKVIEYIDDLNSSGKYIKMRSIEMGKEA